MSEFSRFDNAPKEHVINIDKDTHSRKLDLFPKKTKKYVRIIYRVLLILVILYLAYTLLIHPVDKIFFQYFITTNCELNMQFKYNGGRQRLGNVKMDGNVISNGDVYYEIDGEKVYVYNKILQKKVYKGTVNDINEESYFSNFLDKSNYELVWDKWRFVWQLKEGVDSGDFDKVQISQNIFSEIRISCYYTSGNCIRLTFRKFGWINIDPPWEDK
jgi:hypothetical protein